jgi:hypothetical protein
MEKTLSKKNLFKSNYPQKYLKIKMIKKQKVNNLKM